VTPYAFLKRGKLKSSTLIAIIFSGDMPPSFREAAERIMEERGWIPNGSLVLLKDPPVPDFGDYGIRYMGIPDA
jgi:hypothetical protein